MSTLDTLKKRFRLGGGQKTKVHVQTTCRLETMTVTQQGRFHQLQNLRKAQREPLRTKSWYTLIEAGQRLATSTDMLLRAAAAGRFACFVSTDGIRGNWQSGDDDARSGLEAKRADVSHLRLPPDACRDLEAYGSVNVHELNHPTAQGKGSLFRLAEPLWIDAQRVLLKNPLPAIRAD